MINIYQDNRWEHKQTVEDAFSPRFERRYFGYGYVDRFGGERDNVTPYWVFDFDYTGECDKIEGTITQDTGDPSGFSDKMVFEVPAASSADSAKSFFNGDRLGHFTYKYVLISDNGELAVESYPYDGLLTAQGKPISEIEDC